jgi:exopolysaccharide biosynthesis polyprenyl glycosylphosphotransferase
MTPEQISAGRLAARRHRRQGSPARTDRAAPSRVARRIGRAIDVTISALALAVLFVPMLAIALLVRLTSPGPAFYSQTRVGLNGRHFVLYKFRTMRANAEHHTGPVWATHLDPRRTWIGGLLRRFSIDELPQLFNVLRGDMSLVGPRPERPHFVEQFSRQYPGYAQRHQVLPGITGWAQVNGWRGDSSLEKRLECDLYYVRHWSLILNLRILLLTPLSVLTERNAV